MCRFRFIEVKILAWELVGIFEVWSWAVENSANTFCLFCCLFTTLCLQSVQGGGVQVNNHPGKEGAPPPTLEKNWDLFILILIMWHINVWCHFWTSQRRTVEICFSRSKNTKNWRPKKNATFLGPDMQANLQNELEHLQRCTVPAYILGFFVHRMSPSRRAKEICFSAEKDKVRKRNKMADEWHTILCAN